MTVARSTWGDSMPRKRRQPTALDRRVALNLAALRLKYKPDHALQELADRAHVTATQWRNWEHARSGFPDHQKQIVCDLLGCDVRELFEPNSK
jgi:hypothetical protein